VLRLQDRPEHGISKRSYTSAVLAGLQQFRQAQPAADIIVKLLLSIDRRNDTAAAVETVSCGACWSCILCILELHTINKPCRPQGDLSFACMSTPKCGSLSNLQLKSAVCSCLLV
jgi:hypothetical protein